MKKERISKSFIGSVMAIAMAISSVSTSFAGNVYGDDGSHLKVMTSAGEFSSLPMTDFKGTEIYLLPANATIWISSDGSTADPSTIWYYLSSCPKKDYSNNVDNDFLVWDDYSIEFDKQYAAFDTSANTDIYCAHFSDSVDTSWWEFLYMLDDGSHSVIQTKTIASWQQDSTGWWYQNADGSYPKSTWQLIDGEYYYFNERGYMLSNTTTPDGYKVNSNGAWIQ